MRVGYCRPPAGHGPNKQREALEAAGCELVVDSGIASLLGSVDAGDVVVVASLGALGSTSASAVRAALEIGAKAAELVVLDQGIDTSKEEHGAFFRHAAAIMGVDEGRKGPRAKPGRPAADALPLHLSKPFPHHSALLGIRWPLGFIFRLLGPPLASRAELWYFFIE